MNSQDFAYGKKAHKKVSSFIGKLQTNTPGPGAAPRIASAGQEARGGRRQGGAAGRSRVFAAALCTVQRLARAQRPCQATADTERPRRADRAAAAGREGPRTPGIAGATRAPCRVTRDARPRLCLLVAPCTDVQGTQGCGRWQGAGHQVPGDRRLLGAGRRAGERVHVFTTFVIVSQVCAHQPSTLGV